MTKTGKPGKAGTDLPRGRRVVDAGGAAAEKIYLSMCACTGAMLIGFPTVGNQPPEAENACVWHICKACLFLGVRPPEEPIGAR